LVSKEKKEKERNKTKKLVPWWCNFRGLLLCKQSLQPFRGSAKPLSHTQTHIHPHPNPKKQKAKKKKKVSNFSSRMK